MSQSEESQKTPTFGPLPTLPSPNVPSTSPHGKETASSPCENSGNAGAGQNKNGRTHTEEDAIMDDAASNNFKKRLAEIIGVLISAGSLLSKAPQILQVFRSRSVEGLSLPMFAMEIATQSIAVVYHYHQKFPLSAYGENISLGLGNVAIVLAFWLYSDSSLKAIARKTDLGGFSIESYMPVMLSSLVKPLLRILSLLSSRLSWRTLATLVLLIPAASVPLLKLPKLLNILQAFRNPLYCISRVPQIWQLYSTKTVGELSSVSFAVNLLGSVLRLFTCKHQAINDPSLLAGFWSSIILNALILIQIAMYTKR